MNFEWYYDYISVYDPCLSWETCSSEECGTSTVCYWKRGKKAGLATVCPDCSERNYTMTVFATTN